MVTSQPNYLLKLTHVPRAAYLKRWAASRPIPNAETSVTLA